MIEEKDAKEILEDSGNIKIRNIYFDITPFDFIKGIITEDGIIDQNEVQDKLEEMEVCRALID